MTPANRLARGRTGRGVISDDRHWREAARAFERAVRAKYGLHGPAMSDNYLDEIEPMIGAAIEAYLWEVARQANTESKS